MVKYQVNHSCSINNKVLPPLTKPTNYWETLINLHLIDGNIPNLSKNMLKIFLFGMNMSTKIQIITGVKTQWTPGSTTSLIYSILSKMWVFWQNPVVTFVHFLMHIIMYNFQNNQMKRFRDFLFFFLLLLLF